MRCGRIIFTFVGVVFDGPLSKISVKYCYIIAVNPYELQHALKIAEAIRVGRGL
jgi:hypothetical protein